jgi:hypothetical protein
VPQTGVAPYLPAWNIAGYLFVKNIVSPWQGVPFGFARDTSASLFFHDVDIRDIPKH